MRIRIKLTGTLIFLAAVFGARISSAAIFSSISYNHAEYVENGGAMSGQSLTGTTLPISQTLNSNIGPSMSATYNFVDNGNTATLQITTTASIDGPNQSATEATPGSDSFVFAQPVAYHFFFKFLPHPAQLATLA